MVTLSRILVVDDEISMREMVSVLLKRNGYEVVCADSGRAAFGILDTDEHFDVIVTDLLMDHGGGIDVLTEVKRRQLSCEVIVVTAFGTAETAVEAMKKGAFDYVTKPFNIDEFLIIVRQAVERQVLIRENIDLRARLRGEHRFVDIVGRSQAMLDVMALCRKVADSMATVLISGESGTGKEVVARAIHFSGARAKQPFVAVNCGALPEQLMESELFGHVKGAFTGATADKEGLLLAADKGTLFLDEIGELPPSLQVKMLRVLQERKVRPVGSTVETEFNIRILAATNQDLEDRVKKGLFRTDLFYRLNVIHIQLPPLMKRKEDIPILAVRLLERLASMQGSPQKTIAKDAMRILMKYDYPGNVRELANLLERAATLATGETITAEDLPAEISSRTGRDTTQLLSLPEDGINIDTTLTNLERSLIDQALERTGGVRTQAAKLLGITLRSLRYRINKLEAIESQSDSN
ncbi:MAG: sigma-54-dependent Fis family transcriptional regulator [Deltaproteobacteria bacterium]|nr:sigma-54-dependent Fis family transcriptional regulator [Deltaproteobacteria bacterium]